MSFADKFPRVADQDPLSDPTLPSWKRELILKRRSVNRTMIPRLATSMPTTTTNETRLKSMDETARNFASSENSALKVNGGENSPLSLKKTGAFIEQQQQQNKKAATSFSSAIYPSCYSSIHASGNNLNGIKNDVGDEIEGVDKLQTNNSKSNSSKMHTFDLNGCVVVKQRPPSSSPQPPPSSPFINGLNAVSCGTIGKTNSTVTDYKQPIMGEDKADCCSHSCGTSSPVATTTDSRQFDDVFDETVKDGFDELEYGPGIVHRLRTKFISLTLNRRDTTSSFGFSPVRRVASCEHLLDVPDRDPVLPVRPISPNIIQSATKYQRNVENAGYTRDKPAVLRYASRWSAITPRSGSRTITTDVIKRARSMETLSAIDRGCSSSGSPIINTLFLGVRPTTMTRSVSYVKEDQLVNENMVIIEQTKRTGKGSVESVAKGPSLSTLRVAQDIGRRGVPLDEDEFPKPDTVRTFKRIFEPNGIQIKNDSKKVVTTTTIMGTAKNGSGPQRKVTPPPKPIGLKPSPRSDLKTGAKNTTKIHSTTSKPVFKFLEMDTKEQTLVREPPIQTGLSNGDVTDGTVKPVLATPVSETELAKLVSETESKSSVQNEDSEQSVGSETIAKISGTADLNYVVTHLKPVSDPSPPSSPRLTSDVDQSHTVVNDKPKVISTHPKSDEKPVGHIRPFQKLEQQKNRTNEVKSSSNDVLVNGTATTTTTTTEVGSNLEVMMDLTTTIKKSPSQRPAPITQTFNFVGKDVQPHISNTAAPFSVKRPTLKNIDKVGTKNKENLGPNPIPSSQSNSTPTYIIAGSDIDTAWREFVDEEEEEDDDDDDDVLLQDLGSVDYNKPVNVVFVGSNVIVGRSALLKNRNKKLKIVFDDSAVSTYEYPSEGSLLDDVPPPPPAVHENGFSSSSPSSSATSSSSIFFDGSILSDNVEIPLEAKQPTLKSTPAIGSTGGLASYTPMAVAGSDHTFELGVSRAPQAPLPVTKVTEMTSSTDEEDIFLKPASDEQNSTWSNSETVDLLF